MTIELSSLDIPIRATGREAVLQAFGEIDRAGERTARPITIPVSTPGTQAAVTSFMALDVQAKRNAASFQNLQTRSRQTFDRIAHDVAQATADYRLGIIALDDYSQAIATARTEAAGIRQAVGGLNPEGLKAFNRVLDNVATSARTARLEGRGLARDYTSATDVLAQQAGGARSGVLRVTSAVQQLGVVALGTRSAVGSLASGALISFGASAGITLAVLAGLALLGGAFRLLTARSREAQEKTTEALKRLRSSAESNLPPATQMVRDFTAALREQERVAKLRGATPELSFQGFTQFVSARLAATAARTGDAADKRMSEQFDRLFGIAKQVQAIGEAIEAGKQGLRKAASEESDRAIQELTKAIELRTADRRGIQTAIALMAQLKAAGADETATVTERSKAQEQYNALRAAFTKIADENAAAIKRTADAEHRHLAALVALATAHDLSDAQLEQLRQRYLALRAAIDAATDAEERARLTAEASQAFAGLQAAGAERSATRTTTGSTFGIPTGLERPKTPALDNLTFGADQDRTGSFFAGGALDELTDALDAQAAQASSRVKSALDQVQGDIDDSLDRLHTALAEGLTQSLVNGIAEGFEAGLASGSIGQGTQALTAALLAGLGSAAISFGAASLGIATLMAKIKAAMASLNPVVAIPAAIALIALGGALKGAASRMFTGGGGGGGGTSAEENRDRTVHILLGPEGQAIAPAPSATRVATRTVTAPTTAASQAGATEPRPTIVQQFTIIGPEDHQAQRQLSELAMNGARRGLRYGGAA
jgi:hypothetical protein